MMVIVWTKNKHKHLLIQYTAVPTLINQLIASYAYNAIVTLILWPHVATAADTPKHAKIKLLCSDVNVRV